MSTAGHCPGAANIQCCTYPKCTIGGSSKECIPKAACTKGTPTPGLCKGGVDIQCCA